MSIEEIYGDIVDDISEPFNVNGSPKLNNTIRYLMAKSREITHYSISDYPGNSLNEKWDNLKLQFESFKPKFVHIPIPKPNQEGAVLTSNGWKWKLTAPMIFTDNCNTSKIFVYDEIVSDAVIDAAIRFDDPLKPEDIDFPLGIRIRGNSLEGKTIGVGIDIRAGARINFWGQVLINDVVTGVVIGGLNQSAPVTNIRFTELSCSIFKQSGLLIYGKSVHSVQNVVIESTTIQMAQALGLNAVEVKGFLRDVKVKNIYYATDTAKNGYVANDANNVVLVESNTEGSMLKVLIDSIYQANASAGIKVTTNGATFSAIKDLTIRNVYGKFNATAVDIDYCEGAEIYTIENESNVVVGSNAYYVVLNTGSRMKSITDNGKYTLINGLGKQSRGAGVIPAASVKWAVGCKVRETADNKVYLRIQNTGVDASDFIALN